MDRSKPSVERAHQKAAITGMLRAANEGSEDALEQLVSLLYDELRWLAHRHLLKESNKQLATTELVHEAYLKLAAGGDLPAENRSHFLGSASRAMRQVLVGEARRRMADKRAESAPALPIELAINVGTNDPFERVLAVDTALAALGKAEARLVQVVECRFFAGLSVAETAEAMKTSARTVKRDWSEAKRWLLQHLHGDRPTDAKAKPATATHE